MEDIFIMGIIMAVPITAILSATFLKYKRLELHHGKENGQASRKVEQLAQMVQALAKENAELRQRIENLEIIVTLGEASSDFKQIKEAGINAHQELSSAEQERLLSNEIAKITAERRK